MTRKNKGLHSQHNLIDAISRADFYSFVQRIFPIVSAGSPFLPNWHVEAIAYALTRVMRGEIKRLIITVPPRSLKSICASVAFPAFVLGHDPAKRIICVSYAEELARKHANDCLQQQPVPPGGNLIKWAWFRVYDKPPMRDVGDHTIVSWDTAMSAGELSDYSACVVLHLEGEDAFILDVVRERLDYPDLRQENHRSPSPLAQLYQ